MPGQGERGNQRRPRPYDFGAFRGYRGPRFTPIPDEFLDHQLADLSSAEAKVMLFLFRKTYGYRKSADRVSFAQLEHGTRSSDGTVIDRGTGLSRATIWRALKGLQEKGLIEVERQTTAAGDADINYYHIREDAGPEHSVSQDASARSPGGGSTGRGSRGRQGGAEGVTSPVSGEREGWFSTETTPTSELNHPSFRTKPGGGSGSEPTRTDFTREDLTLSAQLTDLAQDFLHSIGYAKPAPAKRERTVRILRELQQKGQYTPEDLQAACRIAASMGARGPELLPHVIGKAEKLSTPTKVGERLSRQEEEARSRWQTLTTQFEQLSSDEQEELIEAARRSSAILAQRPRSHPLTRAAAIAMLDQQ
jgi:biotin operon repressor